MDDASILCCCLIRIQTEVQVKNSTRKQSPRAGEFDPNFGDNGRVALQFPNTDSCRANGLAVTQDGRIVVGSTTYGAAGEQFGLVRLMANGALDPGFGEAGFIKGNFQAGVKALGGPVAVLENGKILLSGFNHFETSPAYQHVLARYLNDGSPDPSFGKGGQIVIDLPIKELSFASSGIHPASGSSAGQSHFAIQPDGKILLTLHPSVTEPAGIGVLMRFEPDGVPDAGFNGQGFVIVRAQGSSTLLTGSALQSDGKIIVGGGVTDAAELGLVARYCSDGRLDTLFGQGGFATFEIRGLSARTMQITVRPDDRLTAIGIGYWVPPEGLGTNDCAVAGFTAEGRPDMKFNRGIAMLTQPKPGSCHWIGGAAMADGTFLAVGNALGRGGDDQTKFLIGRYLATGALDPSFAEGVGWVITPVFGGGDAATTFALPADDALLVAGNSWVDREGYRATIVRFLI